jgi:dihydroorotate dehydrogenase
LINWYPWVRPVLFRLDAERAHGLALWALRHCGRGSATAEDAALAVRVCGLRFANPVGLAAGFDKNAAALAGALSIGFGHVEVGSVTPRPQAGNPRPRLFRLEPDRAVINRMGFNSDGATAVRDRLAAFRAAAPGAIVGVNLGKNRDSATAAADYAAGAALFAPLADYLVINVSSPNTPGLRALQSRAALGELIAAVGESVHGAAAAPPVLLKIAPDLTAQDRLDIAREALDGGLAGLIVSNTTTARPATLRSPLAAEAGGLSGRPLFRPSTDLLAEMYRLTGGSLPLVGVGGVFSGVDAYAKIRAGASLVQLYTALVYEGPQVVRRIKAELARCLRRDGFARVADAVGADHRHGSPGPANVA